MCARFDPGRETRDILVKREPCINEKDSCVVILVSNRSSYCLVDCFHTKILIVLVTIELLLAGEIYGGNTSVVISHLLDDLGTLHIRVRHTKYHNTSSKFVTEVNTFNQ